MDRGCRQLSSIWKTQNVCQCLLAGWLGWLIELKCISSTCLFNYPRPPNYSTATTTTTTLTSSLGIEQNKNTLTNVTSLIYMRDVWRQTCQCWRISIRCHRDTKSYTVIESGREGGIEIGVYEEWVNGVKISNSLWLHLCHCKCFMWSCCSLSGRQVDWLWHAPTEP